MNYNLIQFLIIKNCSRQRHDDLFGQMLCRPLNGYLNLQLHLPSHMVRAMLYPQRTFMGTGHGPRVHSLYTIIKQRPVLFFSYTYFPPANKCLSFLVSTTNLDAIRQVNLYNEENKVVDLNV